MAFNVVEHIADDIGALRSLGQLVSPTGHVVVFVPAFEMAMSNFDREVGHVRRYTRRSLSATFEAAGLELDAIHYVNSLGLVAWITGMRLLGRRPMSGEALRRGTRWSSPASGASSSGVSHRSASRCSRSVHRTVR